MISSDLEGPTWKAGWRAGPQLTATYVAAFENMCLGLTFRLDDITVKGDLAAVRATTKETITIRATGETQPARLRQLFVLERTEATGR